MRVVWFGGDIHPGSPVLRESLKKHWKTQKNQKNQSTKDQTIKKALKNPKKPKKPKTLEDGTRMHGWNADVWMVY